MIKYTEYKLNSNNNVSFNAGKLPEASALKADRFLKRLSETMSLSQYHDTFNQYMALNPSAVRVHENLIKDNDLYYKWYKEGNSQGSTFGTNNTLVIKEPGKYYCEVSQKVFDEWAPVNE